MSRTRALLLPALAIVAAVALVACGGGGDDPTPTETATATESTPTPTPTTSRTPSPTATPRPSQTESADAVQAISGLKDFIDGYGYPSDATFAELRVPKLGVDAQVASRFVGGDGVMPNPEGPAEVIWYDMSLWQGMGGVPGGGGNAIFSGHVDYDYAVGYAGVHYRGQGVFSQLGKLVEGDIIEVDYGGETFRYTVTDTLQLHAQNADWGAVWRHGSGDMITLYTCGGEFDYNSREYSDRVVVHAQRID